MCLFLVKEYDHSTHLQHGVGSIEFCTDHTAMNVFLMWMLQLFRICATHFAPNDTIQSCSCFLSNFLLNNCTLVRYLWRRLTLLRSESIISSVIECILSWVGVRGVRSVWSKNITDRWQPGTILYNARETAGLHFQPLTGVSIPVKTARADISSGCTSHSPPMLH